MSTDASAAKDQPVDPDVEQLVAYLDGELHGTERDAIEQRLLDEEPLRLQLQELQAGWDWLDQLPDPVPDEKLVESTLELVVSDLAKQSPVEKRPSILRGPLLAIGLCLITAGAAFGFVRYQKNARVNQDLADLTIAEHLDAYLYGSDSRLMRDLMANPAFTTMVSRLEEVRGSRITASELICNTPVEKRADAIAKLTVDQRSSLESRWDYFKRLPPESKDKLRETAASVQEQNDRKQLLDTMVIYANWRETSLSSEMRDQIDGGDPKTRRTAIEEAVKLTLQKISQGSGKLLEDETVDSIFGVLQDLFFNRVANDSRLKQRLELERRQLGERANLRYMYQMLNIKKPGGKTPRYLRSRSPSSVDPITPDELISITSELDEQALDDLRLFSLWSPFFGADPVLEEMTLMAWAEEALLRKAAALETKADTPIEQYMGMDEKERDYLDLLDPSEFKERISRPDADPRGFGGSRRPRR